MTPPTYDRDYFDQNDAFAQPSAAVVVPLVVDLIGPRDVVDVGCGSGAWLAAFAQHGVDGVGVDGAWVAEQGALSAPGAFVACDLETELPDLGRRFELAVSLEVAEHLSPDRAPAFIESLTALSDVVLFSAAIPGQGGRDHLNERWPDYWAALFRERGYALVDALRPRLWDRTEVAWWYRQNTVLFVSRAALSRYPSLAAPLPGPVSMVHPELLGYARRDLDGAREDAAQCRDAVDRYRQWTDTLQADADERIGTLAEWGEGLEREIHRLRAFTPGTVSLRTALVAFPRLLAHAVRRRVSRPGG